MILYCVRHGESTYNAENRIQGQSNVPLSEFGRRQSEAIAAELSRRPIGAVYASPLRRAMETAEPIVRRLGLEIRTDPRLKEIDVGIFQDKFRMALPELYPDEFVCWTSGDLEYRIPGGESRSEVGCRGATAFRQIASGSEGEVAVVAHGRLLVETLRSLLGAQSTGVPLSLQNGSITTLESLDDGGWELRSADAVEHLRSLGLTGTGDL